MAESLEELVAEAVELRFGGSGLPEGQVTPAVAQEVLLDTRKRLDRVEEILVRVIRLRGSARRRASAEQDQVDDAWAKSIQQIANSPQRRSGYDYSGAKERYAEADLNVLDLRIKQRKASNVADQTQTAYDVVKTCHRGLDTLRTDCTAFLRSLQFESHLER